MSPDIPFLRGLYINGLPYVALRLGDDGELALFVVDTGALQSSIPQSLLQKLGAEDRLRPCLLGRWSGMGVASFPVLSDRDELLSADFCFKVMRHTTTGLLGLDFLSSGCCLLNLRPDGPSLLVPRRPTSAPEPCGMMARLDVNGVRVTALLDSGSTALVVCSPR